MATLLYSNSLQNFQITRTSFLGNPIHFRTHRRRAIFTASQSPSSPFLRPQSVAILANFGNLELTNFILGASKRGYSGTDRILRGIPALSAFSALTSASLSPSSPSPPPSPAPSSSPSPSMATERDGKKSLLVYGATGHTGKLVAQKLKERGILATLAGRNPQKLKAVAESAGGLPYEVFDLSDEKRLDEVVSRHTAVLHIAGPFTVTGPPVVEACLRHGAHYLDITGETHFIQWVQSKDREAKEKGVMLMPATGFDVVPGDCLAVYLKKKLPSATHLDLVTFVIRQPEKSSGTALPSHGTLLSGALHIIPSGGLVKREGKFVNEGIGKRTKKFSLGDGKEPLDAFSFPAAELACTSVSSSIPNITIYFPGTTSWPLRALGNLGPKIVNFYPIKSFIEFAVNRLPQPDETKAASSRMWVSGEVCDVTSGKSARAALSVGSGYPFTASACVEIATRVTAGKFTPGFQTPASAYGSDLVLEIPGERTEIKDLP